MTRERKDKARKKAQRAEELWGGEAEDKSWQIHKTCDSCQRMMCINNYQDHQDHTKRYHRKLICAWCSQSGQAKVIATRLVLLDKLYTHRCLKNELPDCKCIACVTRRVL